MQMRQCERAENELILWATVLILQSYNSFLSLPASPFCAAKQLNVLQSHGQHGRATSKEEAKLISLFNCSQKLPHNTLGLDHVVVIHQAHNRETEASTQTVKQTLLTHSSFFLSLHIAVTASTFLSVYLSHHLLHHHISSFFSNLSLWTILEAVTGGGFSDCLFAWPLTACISSTHTHMQTHKHKIPPSS